jgi:hypothetical protein
MPRNKPHVAALIDTPAGRMTRRQAAEHSGIPMATICRRIWEGCPPAMLFATAEELKAAKVLRRKLPTTSRTMRTPRRSLTADSHFVETWVERKARRAAEKASRVSL